MLSNFQFFGVAAKSVFTEAGHSLNQPLHRQKGEIARGMALQDIETVLLRWDTPVLKGKKLTAFSPVRKDRK
jgi:hypothetical protein